MNRISSIRELSGGAMVLGFIIFVPGALFYLSRPIGASPARLVTERAFIMAAIIVTAIGLMLLKEYLTGSGHAWAAIGAYLYLFGAVLIVTAEALDLSGGGSTYGLAVMYVVLALLGQVAIGIAIAISDILPALLGWATIAWNATWLIILPLTTPQEMYFPVLHHAMPLAIGSVLIFGRGDQASAAQPTK